MRSEICSTWSLSFNGLCYKKKSNLFSRSFTWLASAAVRMDKWLRAGLESGWMSGRGPGLESGWHGTGWGLESGWYGRGRARWRDGSGGAVGGELFAWLGEGLLPRRRAHRPVARGPEGYSEAHAGAKTALRPVYEALAVAITELGDDVTVEGRGTYIPSSRVGSSQPATGSTWAYASPIRTADRGKTVI
jgi:hypothetical protein